eukprot:3118765-Alexandrium_andersonii.AAC.1
MCIRDSFPPLLASRPGPLGPLRCLPRRCPLGFVPRRGLKGDAGFLRGPCPRRAGHRRNDAG